jgi:diacylglycerol kinase (ATP)
VSHACIVLNADKSRDAAERVRLALEFRGVSADLVVTTTAEEGRAAAVDALVRGAEWIIAAGGDGTVRSVLDAVLDHNATLAVIPLGTANDFATHLGMPNVDAALAVLADGVVARVDIGECDYLDRDGRQANGVFCSSAGIGVVARLTEVEEWKSARLSKRIFGNSAWMMLTAIATLTTRLARARITVDGDTMELSIGAFEVLKLPSLGGVKMIADASASSGVLHAWVSEAETLRELVRTLVAAFVGSGNLLSSPHVQCFSRDASTNALGKDHVRRIQVSADPAMPLHLNGDYVGTTPVSFVVRPAALRVRMPAARAAEMGLSS